MRNLPSLFTRESSTQELLNKDLWTRRLLPILLALLSTWLVPCPPILGQVWQELGPAPIVSSGDTGRVAALVVSPTRENRYFVGGASGGIWRSTNGGQTWRPMDERLPTLAIGAMAMDPNDENVMYAGSGEANYAYHSLYGLGVYKSVDGGRSWEAMAADTFAGRTFSRLAVSPADSQVIWAAVAPAGGSSEAKEGAREHPNREGSVGVFRSQNGGQTWARVGNGLPAIPASDLLIDPTDGSRVYAAFGNAFGHPGNGVYRSLDGGESFTKVLDSFSGNNVGRIALGLAPSDPRRIYALVVNPAIRGANGGFSPPGASTQGLYRSNNGGNTWTFSNPGNFQGQQGDYNAVVAVHPTEPDTVFLGGVQMLRSRDGGISFSQVTPPHVDLHAIAFDAEGRLLAAGDGGVFRSEDQGDSWSTRNNRLGLVQLYAGLSVHPTDPDFILGGTQDNGSNLYTGNGLGWVRVTGGDGGYTAIDPNDPSLIFTEFQGSGNIFRSTDGGITFNLTAVGIARGDRTAFLPPILFDPEDSTRMLYATHRIYESRDRGLTWQAISNDLTAGPPSAVRALVIAPSNAQTVYAMTNDGRLLTSSDGGRNWQLRREGIAGWPRVTRQLAVDPLDDARAYAAVSGFGGGRLLTTTNQGANWSEIGQGLPDVPVNTVAVHRVGSTRHLLAGTDRGAWLSSDEGASWREYGELPRAPIQDLVVDTFHDRLLASTLGRGVWSTDLPDAAGAPSPCQQTLGSGRFCTECGPCGEGQGDCDNDAECQAGLTCTNNIGAQFGFAPGVDVCQASGGGNGSCPVNLGTGRFCTECGPCGEGQGDCDNDSECRAGLTCTNNVGAQFGFGPNVDVCTAGPTTPCTVNAGSGRFCTECGPCGEGEGDCDNDAECRAGLTCANNVGAQFGFNPNVDVCTAGP